MTDRFIIIGSDTVGMADGNIVILTDVEYWNDHYELLNKWCKDYMAEVRGMTVTLDDKSLTAFCLRWA